VPGGPALGYTFKNWTGDVPSAPNASHPLSVQMNQARTIVANYTTWTLEWDLGSAFAAQYSDPTGLKALLKADASPVEGKTVNFSVGTDTGSAATDTSGIATDPTKLTQNPAPPYTATATCALAQCGVLLTIIHAYDITQEDARAAYTGALFASTACATCSNATVTLAATIQDITAVPGDTAYDAYAGDIRNATVTFVNRDAGNATLCTAPVGLVSLSDTRTGTATCNWNASIGSADSDQYTVGVVVNSYYKRNSSDDNTVVTVSKPGNDSITGGGYLVMANSAGLYPGQPGTKNNFGFNVKYNKSGTNLQGNINTIIRNNGRVYQIKGNAMTSLSVQPPDCAAPPCSATFNGKANIKDITDPLNPISIDGNATLQVTMTDNGDLGDTIGITVWNKNGGLWFSSNLGSHSPPRTIEQKLGASPGGGNLVVH